MEIIVNKDLGAELISRYGCDVETAEALIERTFAQVVTHLKEGASVQLPAFATFSISNGANGVTPDALGAAVAGDLGVDASRASEMFVGALEAIKSKLLEGHEVSIRDFATFKVDEKKAKIIKDARTGQKMISPARKVLGFEAAPALESTLGGQIVSFIPDEGLQEQIANLKVSAILLVVPERDFFVETIEYHFERSGWKVKTAVSAQEALGMLNKDETHLTLLDDGLEGATGLCSNLKCDKDTSLIPLIVMYGKGHDMKRVNGFVVCGDEQVIQPFEVKNLLTLAETELARSSEEEAIFAQEVTFRFPTQDEGIDRANSLGSDLFSASGLSDEGQVALCAAFREAIGNAAQHGNKHRRDKPLEVLYLLDNEKITVAVTDQGGGFDHRQYVNQGQEGDALSQARRSHQAGKLGGLGIMLMLKCVDKLEYNDKGNVITLTKYLK